MSTVRFIKINDVFCSVQGEASAIENLAEQLTFEVPNSKFHPLVQSGMWDGNIRLLNRFNGQMYVGLIEHASEIARSFDYDVDIDPAFDEDPFSVAEATAFIDTLNIPFKEHDFQLDAFIHAIQHRRALILSPTSSGKSLLMYLILMFLGKKAIIVAPTKGIVTQLAKELKGYGYPGNIHIVMGGTEKGTDDMLTISTWQSIYELPSKYFHQYEVFLGDEVHRFTAKSLKQMMEKTTKTPYKIGVTGSLDGAKTHELVLMGLFGPIHETITTREMMDRGIASELEIKVMVFSYTREDLDKIPKTRKVSARGTVTHKVEYKDEVNFILGHPQRNKFIVNLAESLPGNVLILYRRVKDHGDVLLKLLEKGSKPIHYIHGKTADDVREEVRQTFEEHDGIIGLASDGTFSTGISINNIQHLIKVQPIKSVINIKQSIGRGLRKDGKSNKITMFDLADDLTMPGARRKGYLMEHLLERLKIYVKEQFPFKTYKIRLEDKIKS